MSVNTRNPLRTVGGNLYSGGPNTGELTYARAGAITACIWSGALAPSLTGCPAGAVTSGGHTQLWSGAGRLNTIIPHALLTSGQSVTFYDAGAITVSGVSVSGQRFIGLIPVTMRAPLVALSGNQTLSVAWQDQISVDMPFSSGLCVSAASGAPGFTVSFTPEVIPGPQ